MNSSRRTSPGCVGFRDTISMFLGSVIFFTTLMVIAYLDIVGIFTLEPEVDTPLIVD